MIFVGAASHAQYKVVYVGNSNLTVIHALPPVSFVSVNKPQVYTTNKQPFIAADFYSTQLGFICRQEIKMDKALKIAFRFRLGSIDQCNWLEGRK